MNSPTKLSAILLSVFISVSFSNVLQAEPHDKGKGSGHHSMGQHGGGQHGYGHADKHGGHKGHRMGAHWTDALSEQQRKQIDKMHLELGKKTSTLKARIKLAKVELAITVTKDKPNKNTINKKIDEILEFKRQKMYLKYAHITEMRKILNEDQRVSFDMSVLEKAKKRRHKGH